ncbi:amidohydrolase family protein [Candidatus Giovannonibacteria bacterium]|nr:amidohydrolase family protein [Candidatus Giovannonibacteria bacterium]
MAYSVLIKNGTILDGTGGDLYKADIGIVGDKIKDIGDLKKSSAEKVIDASNLYVTPGFIDLTSHSDTYWTLFSAPGQESMLMQGVTTILLGNCGESLAPIIKKESFAALERWSTAPSLNANWNTVKEYLETIEKIGIGVNTATMVGQETLRRGAQNLEETTLLLTRAIKDGAWGLSSNFSFVEWSGKLDNETVSLLNTIAAFDGIYKVHLRDEGKDFLPAIASVVNLIRRSKVKTVLSHFKGVGKSAWRDFDKAVTMVRSAQQDGLPIYFDFSPYLRTGSMLVSLLPQWARTGDSQVILERLHNPITAEKIISNLRSFTLHPERYLIASAVNDRSMVGKTLEEITNGSGRSLEENIVEILKINNLSVNILGKTVSGRNILQAAKEPWAVVATDGAGLNIEMEKSGNLTHPRSFGTYARYFSKIGPKAGVSPQVAIRQSSLLPAELTGIPKRGKIAKGFFADIAVFHPEEFKDNGTYKNPYHYASGMIHVLVGGKHAVENGKISGKRFGKVIKKTA